MENAPRKVISSKQWDDAAEQYELGLKHARQIARELGVSPATVSREFKRRGALKASRVAESIAPLIAELDAKDRAKARLREAEAEAAARRSAELTRMVDEMMKGIVAAEKSGSIAAAAPIVEKVGRSLAA